MSDLSAASLEFAHGCRWPDSRVDLARLIDDAIAARLAVLSESDNNDVVEIMARATAHSRGNPDDSPIALGFRGDARFALAALREAGYVVHHRSLLAPEGRAS